MRFLPEAFPVRFPPHRSVPPTLLHTILEFFFCPLYVWLSGSRDNQRSRSHQTHDAGISFPRALAKRRGI